jgi:HSP20 family protein
MKEQEAKNKANQTNSGNNEEKEDLSISEILNKFAVKESNSNKFPSINVLEENSTYIYLIDLPGIQKESISIEIKDNRILSISAERTKPANLTANESYFGVINRDIELPENYSGEVLASYENGVLSLMIEKKQNTVKKINII